MCRAPGRPRCSVAAPHCPKLIHEPASIALTSISSVLLCLYSECSVVCVGYTCTILKTKLRNAPKGSRWRRGASTSRWERPTDSRARLEAGPSRQRRLEVNAGQVRKRSRARSTVQSVCALCTEHMLSWHFAGTGNLRIGSGAWPELHALLARDVSAANISSGTAASPFCNTTTASTVHY